MRLRRQNYRNSDCPYTFLKAKQNNNYHDEDQPYTFLKTKQNNYQTTSKITKLRGMTKFQTRPVLFHFQYITFQYICCRRREVTSFDLWSWRLHPGCVPARRWMPPCCSYHWFNLSPRSSRPGELTQELLELLESSGTNLQEMIRELPHQNGYLPDQWEQVHPEPRWRPPQPVGSWIHHKNDLQELLGVQEQAWPPDPLPQGRWPPKQKCKTLSLEDHQEELRTSSQITFKDTVIRPNEIHNLILQWIKPFCFIVAPNSQGFRKFPSNNISLTNYQRLSHTCHYSRAVLGLHLFSFPCMLNQLPYIPLL